MQDDSSVVTPYTQVSAQTVSPTPQDAIASYPFVFFFPVICENFNSNRGNRLQAGHRLSLRKLKIKGMRSPVRRIFDSIPTLHSLGLGGSLDSCRRRLVKTVVRSNVDVRVLEDLLSLLDIGSLETDDEGDTEVELLDGSDDAL